MTAHWKDYGRETRGQAVNAPMTEIARDCSWRQDSLRPRSARCGKHWAISLSAQDRHARRHILTVDNIINFCQCVAHPGQ